jgi:hypothetical protein
VARWGGEDFGGVERFLLWGVRDSAGVDCRGIGAALGFSAMGGVDGEFARGVVTREAVRVSFLIMVLLNGNI